MLTQFQLRILLALLLYSVLALALTLPGLPSTNVTVNELGSEFQCSKGSRFSRQRPKFSDCAGAIRQLRDNHIPGEFHRKGVLNPYQLPVTKWHNTCLVTVDMEPGRDKDEGTWLGVSLAATQLNQACVGTSAFPKFQGGFTHAGLYDGIRVVLEYREPNNALLGNGTAQSSGTLSVGTDSS
ncbi:hypothetical protein ACLMJK_005099 [Lecanora helva]